MSLTISGPAYLRNPVYAALSTADAPFALVHGVARRFRPEIIPFAGFPEPSAEALRDLVALLAPGEEIYLTAEPDDPIVSTDSLEVVSVMPGVQMGFDAATPIDEDDAVVIRLGDKDVDEMIDLKARAFPGYFGPRAVELGSFFGVRERESGRLVAMGGERLATDTDREISAVCTDPEYVGQGLGARIVRAVLHHQSRAGRRSFLHATADNVRAISLYEHLGFRLTGTLDFVKVRRV